MSTQTRPTIESLYAEIQQVDEVLTGRDADPDSAEYWREAVDLKTRQRDAWQRIAELAVAQEDTVPEWARRAAFLAYDNCADKIYRYEQFERQCAQG